MKGVAAFLQVQAHGTLRLVLNDVESLSGSSEPDWKHLTMFTHNDYDADELKALAISKEQFAAIGENLVIRLLASGGHIE